MKTITISDVSLQFDLKDSEDVKQDTRRMIKRVNKILEITFPDSQPQIIIGESATMLEVDLPNEIVDETNFKL